MTLGEKLREARKNAGLSQEQFAEMLCVSRAAVAKWETDRGMPDVNNLKTMAQLLNVTKDFIISNELGAKVEPKRFVLGNNKYVSAYRIL